MSLPDAAEPDAAPTLVDEVIPEVPAVTLRGTARGVEILVVGEPTVEAIGGALEAKLAEAPGFFAGNDVRVTVEGKLPGGALARLEGICTRYDLRIVEVGRPVARARASEPAPLDPVPEPNLATGSAPVGPGDAVLEPVSAATEAGAEADAAPVVAMPSIESRAEAAYAALEVLAAAGPRLVVGPVRSGVVLEHPGHLVVIGDVNPGAEVRAEGNIIILGRLKGVAHAAIGREAGFILALSLQPQQLRVGRLVARAAADDGPGEGAEIAYATGKTIVVERYQGKLPSGLTASM